MHARALRTRSGQVALTATLLVAPLLLPGTASGASAPSAPTVQTGSVVELQDWASTTLGDAWDFSNADEIHTQGQASIDGGMLNYSPSGTVQPNLLWSMASSQPWGKDGRLNPVDADRHKVLTLRLWSDRQSAGGVSWARCSWAVTSCRGFQSFMMQPGWNTYRLVLQGAGLSSAPAPWAGRVEGLRLTGAAGPKVKVDWARLVDGTSARTAVSWTDQANGRKAELYWDSDTDRANNVAGNPRWGLVGSTTRKSATNTVSFDHGSMPPGRYHFYAVSEGVASAHSAPLTIVPRPRPVIHTPTFSAGSDYATAVRRDPWDMAQRSDFGLHNANLIGMNGRWMAADSTTNDPGLRLPVPRAFSGSQYHRLTVRVALLGGWGLHGGRGGGCVGRLLWTTASGGPNRWQTTDDLVLFPGWNTVTVDLATSPSSKIVDPVLGSSRIGWAGQTITAVRFDPHEDPGARRFYVDDVKLTTHAASVGGAVNLRFEDMAKQPGTTATVYAVDTAGRALTAVSGLPVGTSGATSWTWRPSRAVPAGLYRFKVVLNGPGGGVARWAQAPVRVTPA